MSQKTAVIGGGASGMMSAISSAEKGNEVTIFEKNEILGKKILITGNGRCNITNIDVSFKNYHGKHPRFAASVLSQFSNDNTVQYFENLGLVLKEEDNGRLFPRSNQAQSVIDVLIEEITRLNVEVKLNQKIRSIKKSKDKFEITTYQKKKLVFDSVIIATGGKSYPNTGSTGDGYRFAERLGHKIVDTFPASVPVRIRSIICNKLQGIKIDAGLKIIQEEKIISDRVGELLFTHFGISAPVVLESSRVVSEIMVQDNDAKIRCSIDLFPDYDLEKLRELLKKRILTFPDRTVSNQFIGILPKKVGFVVLENTGFDPLQKSRTISNKAIHELSNKLKDLQFDVLDTLGWELAQFTAGGVSTDEIESKTMESKLVPGLFFCGEVVDIDGDSGGYNLQWAWSSGCVAGMSS